MSKDWYIWCDGIKIPVTEEVYRIYKRAFWREEKQDAVRQNRKCSFYIYDRARFGWTSCIPAGVSADSRWKSGFWEYVNG